jgi:hypothetical protein
MARLKSRDVFPPGEFQILHPEVGMREPFHGSFSEACSFEIRFRKSNPGICQQNGWTTNAAEVAVYVDEYNALRCMAGGWPDFVDGGNHPELAYTQTAEKKSLLGNVVDKARAMRAAASTYLAMFGEGGLAAQEEASARAAVCSICPQNDKSKTLWAWFADSAAKDITQVIEHLKGISMTTPLDDQLGVCKACECPMKAKVWARLDHIVKHIPKDVVPKLDGECWIRAGLK